MLKVVRDLLKEDHPFIATGKWRDNKQTKQQPRTESWSYREKNIPGDNELLQIISLCLEEILGQREMFAGNK